MSPQVAGDTAVMSGHGLIPGAERLSLSATGEYRDGYSLWDTMFTPHELTRPIPHPVDQTKTIEPVGTLPWSRVNLSDPVTRRAVENLDRDYTRFTTYGVVFYDHGSYYEFFLMGGRND